MTSKLEPSVEAPAQRQRGRVAKLTWLALGWILFGIGVVGVVIPGLPTTGPMLLALACFARGSDRLHDWLLHHKWFGPPLQHWRQHRVISIRAKFLAVSMMGASFAYVALASSLASWAVFSIGGLIAVGATVVLCHPHKVRQASTQAAAEPPAD